MKCAVTSLILIFFASSSAQAAERSATATEIKSFAVGHDINCGGAICHYGADGSYSYNGASPGRYRISSGMICVNFNDGGQRCDHIVVDGTSYSLINKTGQRFDFSK